MKRRDFIALSTVSIALPTLAQAYADDYTPGAVKAALANGDTVFLDFKASWCTTCAAQERVIQSLVEQNPVYDEQITFFNVDWDQYARADLTQSLKIPRRSTLVVLKGSEELGRIVAETSESAIKELMDTALAAATSA